MKLNNLLINLKANPFIKFALILTFTMLTSISNSQTFVAEEIEMLNKPNARYEQIKDSLPFYYFTYANCSAYFNESNFDQNNLKARCYIVNFPVLINGNLEQDPFKIWVDAIKFKEDTTLTNLNFEQRMKLEEKEKVLNDLKAQKLKEKEKAYEGEDSTQRAQRLQIEKENAAKAAFENQIQDSKNKKASKDKKDVPKEQNNLETKYKDSPLTKEQLKAKHFPDSIVSRVFEMGENEGLRWIYNQQIVAGNVLYCNTDSSIPVYLDKGKVDPMEEYKKLLTQWKEQYQSIWKNSYSDDHLLIVESVDTFSDRKAKASMIGQNFNQHQKQYQREFSKTGVQ